MADLLVIVDIQNEFLQPCLNPIAAALRRRCREFMEQGKPIVTTLQYGYSALHECLAVGLADYPRHHSVVKYADEGSTEVARRLQKEGLSVRTVLLGGINACCCVLGTGSGLVGLGYDVVLDDDLIGCAAPHALAGGRSREECLHYLRENLRREPYPYVKLLRQWPDRRSTRLSAHVVS